MIEIVPYDPSWPAAFATLRDRLAPPLAGLATRIEHVGSTAVPGLAAKPVIDVTFVLNSADQLPGAVSRLAPLGYRHVGESFTAPAGPPAHHLSVWAADHPGVVEVLAFRDYLRTHPDTARAYAELKYYLADRFHHDRAGYTAAKSAFISRVLATTTGRRFLDRRP